MFLYVACLTGSSLSAAAAKISSSVNLPDMFVIIGRVMPSQTTADTSADVTLLYWGSRVRVGESIQSAHDLFEVKRE